MVETDGLIEAVLRETEQARRPRMYAVWPGTSLCDDDVGKGVCTGLMIPLDHAEMNGMIVVAGFPAASRAEYYCAQGERASEIVRDAQQNATSAANTHVSQVRCPMIASCSLRST